METVASTRVEAAGSEIGSVSIADLIAAKVRFLLPTVVIYMVGYIGLTVLAGFAKGLVAQKVAGALNLGFLLIGCNYVLSWVLALVYVRVANSTFDPMVEGIAAGKRARGVES
jgi:uncharacterized membrane protein (DUF485 family)